jgi:hypothetical protein
MMRIAAIAVFFAGFAIGAPGPVVRASITTPRPIIVGQTVRINVTVLVPNYFLGEPEFPQFDMDNAIVVLPGETPQNSNETIAGQTYAGISVTYMIYPQQPGSFKLPPAEIAVKYASDPPKSTEVRLALPTLTFAAVLPPEAADLEYFLPTTSLKISQKLDKPLKNLRVGDTVTRTVTIAASKMRAMLIPPTKFEAPDGIAVYPKEPRVDDIKTDRGEFVEGRRVDSATYLIGKDGDYTLPPIEIEWWSLDRSKVETATLPAIHFSAAPNPNANPEIPPEPEPVIQTVAPNPNRFKHYGRLAEIAAILLLVIGVAVWAWFRFGVPLVRRWRNSRAAYKHSEAAFFGKLKKASQAGNAEEAYALLLGWLNRFRPGVELGQFLSKTADPELTREVESLASMLYGGSSAAWSGNQMIKCLARVRSRRHRELRSNPALPPLNPA